MSAALLAIYNVASPPGPLAVAATLLLPDQHDSILPEPGLLHPRSAALHQLLPHSSCSSHCGRPSPSSPLGSASSAFLNTKFTFCKLEFNSCKIELYQCTNINSELYFYISTCTINTELYFYISTCTINTW